MPIREYHCEGCGETYEKLEKVYAEPLEVCEKCGSKNIKQLLTTAKFKFTEPWRKKRIV